ncbi:Ankyrin repeat [Arabidopsis suecica]|uniref:Ankyrin repeat n=1 Tax=Arabidopsis suecica TaxID=45249 RepID=A0A8T1XYK1_ARASU|nr:Ankyrin repeat [Arabidopsis suecica]
MEQKLLLVTNSGSVHDLYSLIRAEPNILHNLDVLPFIHTPLHAASSAGKIDLAMELMILKPSFAKKLNADGFSPLHLAVENQQDKLARELAKFDPSLVRIRGRGGMTPLHLVARNGDVELLTEFLLACPESITDANVNGETALHITVIYDRFEELKLLTGWMQKRRNSVGAFTEIHVLNRRDRNGDTALHLAADRNNHKVVKKLLKCMTLDRNIQNNNDMTALDVLRANRSPMSKDTEKIIKKSGGKTRCSLSKVEKMSEFLRKPVTFREYCKTKLIRYRSHVTDGSRNALLVITALIITATYEAVSDPKELKGEVTWHAIILNVLMIWGFNTTAFIASIVLTFILLPVGRAYTRWYMFITVPLVCSYAISIYMMYESVELIILYLMILFGFLVYLLVFYVRWKRTTLKKVSKPKIELISQDFPKTTV